MAYDVDTCDISNNTRIKCKNSFFLHKTNLFVSAWIRKFWSSLIVTLEVKLKEEQEKVEKIRIGPKNQNIVRNTKQWSSLLFSELFLSESI